MKNTQEKTIDFGLKFTDIDADFYAQCAQFANINQGVIKEVEEKTLIDNVEYRTFILEKFVIPLSELKQDRIKECDFERNKHFKAGTLINGILWDFDSEAKTNITGKLILLQTIQEQEIKWFDWDNMMHIFTPAEFMQFAADISSAIEKVWVRNAEIKSAIENAQSEEDLNTISLSFEAIND